jgi:shikimate dehydrogenase
MNRAGIKGAYVPFRVEPGQIDQALHSLRVLNISGANITVPYKEVVIPYLDELSEGARIIGAVNTIVVNGKILKGYNTNAIGFMDGMNSAGIEIAGKSALVFGTGGMAKAVVFILNWLRAEKVIVAGRNDKKIEEIICRFGGEGRLVQDLPQQPIRADFVVNATSVSSPDESNELAELVEMLELRDCKLAVDLNYGRKRNFWKDMAYSRGIPFMDGLPFLAHQARRTLALWTKIQIPAEAFLNVLARDGNSDLD